MSALLQEDLLPAKYIPELVFPLVPCPPLPRENNSSSPVSFLIPDQIDENLKLALQQDLTSMAPGLVIQVSFATMGESLVTVHVLFRRCAFCTGGPRALENLWALAP